EHLLPLTALRLYLSSVSIKNERSPCLSSKWKNPKKRTLIGDVRTEAQQPPDHCNKKTKVTQQVSSPQIMT
ncbi:hypothetical protein P7K49_008731, partial [Saguinus oedipus]